jgi:mRNA-degrading endonuclease toxin of MazEF toxin-antitoxin module
LSINQGDIVWARKADPNGVNEKVRPFVILTRNEDIANGGPILAADVTGTLPDPITSGYVELPWNRTGRVSTGLRKRCAVCCHWLEQLEADAITNRCGYVPGAKLREIVELRATQEENGG